MEILKKLIIKKSIIKGLKGKKNKSSLSKDFYLKIKNGNI